MCFVLHVFILILFSINTQESFLKPRTFYDLITVHLIKMRKLKIVDAILLSNTYSRLKILFVVTEKKNVLYKLLFFSGSRSNTELSIVYHPKNK